MLLRSSGIKLRKNTYNQQAATVQCIEVHFASLLSVGFITFIHSSKSSGKETGKMHLCAVAATSLACRVLFCKIQSTPLSCLSYDGPDQYEICSHI